ncbi:MAG: hypothetical protein JSR24_05305 [Proteobacteria bacterium]|nr:hypothetical protein [Pseudomonadota bacterium]
MRGMQVKQIRLALVPVALAAGLGACANGNGVAPGYVTGPSSASASSGTYGSGNYTPTGQGGRVVSVNEVALRGGGGGRSTNGMVSGGLIGAAGGTAIGAVASRSVGGALVGAVLGAVGGAIAGNIMNSQGGMGGGRGVEVMVQKDDGQTVRIAQRDDGDIQLGDRVQIVQDRNGVAKAVRDTSPAPDYGSQPPPQDYNGQYNSQYNGPYNKQFGGPQDTQGNGQRYVPRGQDYPQDQRYSSTSYNDQARYAPQPQDDPRYGNLE